MIKEREKTMTIDEEEVITNDEEEITITPSSGNVFADAGLPDAEECLARCELLYYITDEIKRRNLSLHQVAELLAIRKNRARLLLRGRFTPFSLDDIIAMLKKLGVSLTLSCQLGRADQEGHFTLAMPREMWSQEDQADDDQEEDLPLSSEDQEKDRSLSSEDQEGDNELAIETINLGVARRPKTSYMHKMATKLWPVLVTLAESEDPSSRNGHRSNSNGHSKQLMSDESVSPLPEDRPIATLPHVLPVAI